MYRSSIALAALAILTPLGTASSAPLARAPLTLDSIRMVTTTVGWAIAGSSAAGVYRTTDGGRDWTRVLTQPSSALAGAFLDARIARVAVTRSYAGRTVRVYRTEDAGLHWRSTMLLAPAMSTGSVLQLDFPDSRHGWLLAGVAPGMGHLVYTLWRTTDGGAHWTRVAFDVERRRSSGAFPGCNCLGGTSTGITFRNNGRGWVTGEPFATAPPWIYATRDAGRAWTPQHLPRFGGRVARVTHAPVFVGGAVGYLPVELSLPGLPSIIVGTYVTRNGGRTWRPTASASAREPMSKQVGGFSYTFIAGGQGWIAARGYLWHTANGGRGWQRLPAAGLPRAVAQIQFLNRSQGFAVSTSVTLRVPRAYLFRTSDGGRSWQRVPTFSVTG